MGRMGPLFSCDLYGGSEASLHLRVDGANFGPRIDRFDVLRCAGCGLGAMSPFPTEEDLRELYVDRGVFSQTWSNPNHLPHRAQRFLHWSLGTYDMPTGRRFIRNYQLRMLWAILLDGRASPLLGMGDCLYGFFRKPAS